MLIDLNHNSGARYETETSLSAAVNAHIDEALLTRQRLQARRDYLGASRIGEATVVISLMRTCGRSAAAITVINSVRPLAATA